MSDYYTLPEPNIEQYVITDEQRTAYRAMTADYLLNFTDVMRVKSGVIQSGNFVSGSTGWQLNAQGNLEANNGTFRGDISAASGTLGGFTIGASSLSVTSGGNTVTLSSSTNALIAGPTGSPSFTLTQAGALTATSGTIAGWTLSSTSLSGGNATLSSTGVLTLGTSNDVVIASAADATYRLWVGNSTAASASFRVTKAGAVTCTDLTATGSINFSASFNTSGTSLINTVIPVFGFRGGIGGCTMSKNGESYLAPRGGGANTILPFRAYKNGNVFYNSSSSVGTTPSLLSLAFVSSTYAYGMANAGTTVYRYNSDGTGEQAMTFSGTSISSAGVCGSDDTDLFIQDGGSGGTTIRQYSISGTTLTHVGNITIASPGTAVGMLVSSGRIYICTASSLIEYNRSTGATVSTRNFSGSGFVTGQGVTRDINGRVYLISLPGYTNAEQSLTLCDY